MCFRENINGRSKRANKQVCSVINIFHGVNLILYTVTNIYPNVWILIECTNIFYNEKLAFLMLTSIHSILKSTKAETPKQQNKR